MLQCPWHGGHTDPNSENTDNFHLCPPPPPLISPCPGVACGASLTCPQGLMSEAMDQPAGSPGNPKPGEGGEGSMEPGTCQELLHRLRELEVGHGAAGGSSAGQSPGELGWVLGCGGPSSQPALPGWSRAERFFSRAPLRTPFLALCSLRASTGQEACARRGPS